jgi:long-subunit acyl-CoA synthetase (AMP-forming)
MTSRDPARGAEALAEVRERSGNPTVELVPLDLASFESIKKFTIMSPALSVPGGTLTATLKVRRKMVYELFKPQFEGMYR